MTINFKEPTNEKLKPRITVIGLVVRAAMQLII